MTDQEKAAQYAAKKAADAAYWAKKKADDETWWALKKAKEAEDAARRANR